MKVGLVGAGFMGSVHLSAYAQMPEAEVVAVADPNPQAASSGAATVGARAYSSYEEVAAAEDVEVVDVCLPTAYHREVAVRAANDGKHVILEKPISRSIEDAEAILEAFEGSEGRLFVGHVVRFFPEYTKMQAMIHSGELGNIGVARTGRRSPFLTGWNDWYADWRMSGGVLVDLLIHDFDFLRWALGEVERVYAKAVMGREYNRLDYALVTLRFESGAIAHAEGHWGYPAPFNYSVEIAGSKKLVRVDSTEPEPLEVLVSGEAETGPPPDGGGKSPYQLELEHFIRCAGSGKVPIVSGRDAFEALRISLAATESVRTGKPIALGGSR